MECPRCQARTRVLESRGAEDGAAIRRRRHCASCGHRFTTYERREREPLIVRKRDGERQRFDRTKLRAALLRAAHKRPVSAESVEDLVGRVELAVEAAGGELDADRIAALCLEGLRDLDLGAYMQFAGTLPGATPEFAPSEGTGSVRVGSDAA
jgi:transcriptional repressor NrdR